jgi:hypothetical protein
MSMKNLKLKKMSVISKYRTIIQQDDCAPDAGQQFEKEFSELFGRTISSITDCIVPVDLGDTFVYLWGNFRISNEIGVWKVESVEPDFAR